MKPKRVLIVDDALELGRLLKATLSSMDSTIEIVVAPSAEEAFLETSRQKIDLLVTDFRLPGMSGAELVKRIRQTQPGIKVILITGVSENQMPEEGKNLIVDFFLKKPMEIADFLSASKKCLGLEDESERPARKEEPRISRQQIGDRLESLRSNLNAISVCLIDDQGNIRLKTGEFPEKNFEIRWLPTFLNILTADNRVIHQFNPPIADGVHSYIGPNFSMILMTLNEMALLTILKPEPGHNHMIMALGVVMDAQRELIKALRTSELNVATVQPEKVRKGDTGSLPGDQEFRDKLQKGGKGVKKEAASQFWDTASEGDEGRAGNLEGITWQDAEKMGLLNNEGKKK
jgi:DNA-binding response OmpR family regulator